MARLGTLPHPVRDRRRAWADHAPPTLEALCDAIRVRGHSDAEVAAALALVAGAGDPVGIVQTGLELAQRQSLDLSSAVLLMRSGRSLADATAMVPQMQSAGAEPGIARAIAVLLLNAPLPDDAPMRFQKLRQWIAAYTPNEASRSAALRAPRRRSVRLSTISGSRRAGQGAARHRWADLARPRRGSCLRAPRSTRRRALVQAKPGDSGRSRST